MRKIKYTLLLFILFGSIQSSRAQNSKPNFGVGLRVGDPLGLTLKKYLGNNALELNLGRSYLFNRRGWYDRRFNDWYGNKKFGYSEFQYVGYNPTAPISIQLHYLFQRDIKSVENLQWYWGLGAQFRFQRYTFDYRYKVSGDPTWRYALGESVTNVDFGADGILGLEYTFAGLPISVFGDMNLFLEFADNPFALWFQAGVGGRFNF